MWSAWRFWNRWARVPDVFLRFNGVSASTVPPPASVAGPFVEDVAQDNVDVPAIAKRLAVWFPVS